MNLGGGQGSMLKQVVCQRVEENQKPSDEERKRPQNQVGCYEGSEIP